VSMQCGPKADTGFDLALTELLRERHRISLEVGSAAASLLQLRLKSRAALRWIPRPRLGGHADSRQMGRALDNEWHQRPATGYSSIHAGTSGERCLSCANCTMGVRPALYDSGRPHRSIESSPQCASVSGTRATRWILVSARPAACANRPARATAKDDHKLAHWIDQFGTSGCVAAVVVSPGVR